MGMVILRRPRHRYHHHDSNPIDTSARYSRFQDDRRRRNNGTVWLGLIEFLRAAHGSNRTVWMETEPGELVEAFQYVAI